MSDIYNSTKPINQGETQSVKQEAKKERTILDKGLGEACWEVGI